MANNNHAPRDLATCHCGCPAQDRAGDRIACVSRLRGV